MADGLTDEQVRKLADGLQGTGSSVTEKLNQLFDLEENDMTTANCAMLDSIVFCCTTCDNWYEVGEMSDDPAHDWECRDCATATDGDD